MEFLGFVIPTRIGEYLIATVVIVLAPGPSVLFVIARAISWGRRVAVLTVLGNASGALTLSVVVALGSSTAKVAAALGVDLSAVADEQSLESLVETTERLLDAG